MAAKTKTAKTKTPAELSRDRLAAAEHRLAHWTTALERVEEALEDLNADALTDDTITGSDILAAEAEVRLNEARVKAASTGLARAKSKAVPDVLDLGEVVAAAVRTAIDGWGVPVHAVAALPSSVEDGSNAVYVVQSKLSTPGKHSDGGPSYRLGQVEVHHLRQPVHGPIPAEALDAALDAHRVEWSRGAAGSRTQNATARLEALTPHVGASKVDGAAIDGVIKFHRVRLVPHSQRLKQVDLWSLKSLGASLRSAASDIAGVSLDERHGSTVPNVIFLNGGSHEVVSEDVDDKGIRRATVKVSVPMSEGVSYISTPERLVKVADAFEGRRVAGVGTLSNVEADTEVRTINGHAQGSLVLTAVATSEVA